MVERKKKDRWMRKRRKKRQRRVKGADKTEKGNITKKEGEVNHLGKQ